MGLTSTNRKICDDPWRVSLSRRASTLHHLSHINKSSNNNNNNYHNRFDGRTLIQSTKEYYAQRNHDTIREEPPGDTYADFLVFLSISAEVDTIPTEIVIHKEDDVDDVTRRRTSLSCQSSTIDTDWNMNTRLPTGYVWI